MTETKMQMLTLEEISEVARNHKASPSERRAQRISLITSLLPKETSLTKDKVKSMLDEIEGNEGK